MSLRRDAIYHGSYMGRAPHDEPSVLALALNDVFVPILRKVFPEIVDFHLPPEACSYRIAVVSIRKQYPGHARRIMMGIWSYLRQFTYTKFVIVTDDDIDVRDWSQVIWAVSTRVDPARDSLIDREHADRLPRLLEPGAEPGLQARPRRHQQVARARPPGPGAGRSCSIRDVERRVDELWQQDLRAVN